MFRGTAVGPYDEVIAKATDENLTSEDWGAIIEVCDKVGNDPNGPNQAVQSLIKRLAHRNANVQLYTLELANALSQNCGKNMHRELASRAFTDALLKLANDRNTHQQVKVKILERMKEWSDMFSKDADLGIMYDAYYRLKQSNPTLQPPSAPQKTGLTDLDRQKEEEELQIALKLSLQEEERKKGTQPTSSVAGPSSSAGPSATAAPVESVPSHPTGTTAATVSRVRALYDFAPSEPGELEFKKGDIIAVLESVYKDWWRGSLKGRTGIFPLNYVEKLADPTPDELHREAQMEAEVFAEIKNVEKLLTLLSTSNASPKEEDNEEISKLYHQTLAIRPKLIKLIEKYSQKKEDFTQLNEKFIKARRDYESLLESSMSHPPQPNYHQYAPRPLMPHGYGVPGGPGGPGPGSSFAPQGPPPNQQEPQRFYTPGPQGPPPQEQNRYQATSPPPSFQRLTPAPAPFYLQGAEVPAQANQQPPQQYPPRDQPSRIAAGKQPAPLQTSSPPPQAYQAYSQPAQAEQRPQSTYGNPQELATSAYDSPIAATHNPSRPDPYSASVYSQEDPYATSPTATAPSAPSAPVPSAPPGPAQGVPTPLAIASHPSAPSQPQYSAYNPNVQRQDSYDAPSQIPPQPTGSAPPIPQGVQPPSNVMTPPPLHPGGLAFDARQSLPSQAPLGQPQQPQYKAYVPPGNEPSAPQDFYRQNAAY
ncbi:Class E vacuolar protein-sorting machinery protein HSE1 [Daldinia childiae]|uniref:Class E vacuolar protein-sorting machinery protein HSE1 n=1 Tax=Daldinia childiae TaxID=326645 RepID=UPI0014458EC7|nr:Class E vacuolar protein-sorting machinery protein HSE1 [Daldinia childiae]KAF3055054.1 Class E vacuolar protein-sorting machinery protein HSE1 [Daldinia childiae]